MTITFFNKKLLAKHVIWGWQMKEYCSVSEEFFNMLINTGICCPILAISLRKHSSPVSTRRKHNIRDYLLTIFLQNNCSQRKSFFSKKQKLWSTNRIFIFNIILPKWKLFKYHPCLLTKYWGLNVMISVGERVSLEWRFYSIIQIIYFGNCYITRALDKSSPFL